MADRSSRGTSWATKALFSASPLILSILSALISTEPESGRTCSTSQLSQPFPRPHPPFLSPPQQAIRRSISSAPCALFSRPSAVFPVLLNLLELYAITALVMHSIACSSLIFGREAGWTVRRASARARRSGQRLQITKCIILDKRSMRTCAHRPAPLQSNHHVHGSG